MHPIVNIAVKAARLAGKRIVQSLDQVENLVPIEKSKNDFVSEVDQLAEAAIISTIHKAYPNHCILAEESGLVAPVSGNESNPPMWIVDPLDGTTNFLHGIPHFCVSIAVKHHDKIQHAVIYDPIRDELFTASRGSGAQLNGKRLRVRKTEKLEAALLGTGFPFRQFDLVEEYWDFFKLLLPHCSGLRRAGAAALDLAYVAAGRLDGFWEFGLKPWDVAAGSLLVQEAGGWVTTLQNDLDFLDKGNILAAPPKIHQQMQTWYQQSLSR